MHVLICTCISLNDILWSNRANDAFRTVTQTDTELWTSLSTELCLRQLFHLLDLEIENSRVAWIWNAAFYKPLWQKINLISTLKYVLLTWFWNSSVFCQSTVGHLISTTVTVKITHTNDEVLITLITFRH